MEGDPHVKSHDGTNEAFIDGIDHIVHDADDCCLHRVMRSIRVRRLMDRQKTVFGDMLTEPGVDDLTFETMLRFENGRYKLGSAHSNLHIRTRH